MFVAGEERWLVGNAELGFHQYKVVSPIQMSTFEPEHEQMTDQAYLLSRGVSQAFVDNAFQAAPDSMWLPDHRTLLDEGVLTR